jgi:hypothetical protein
MIQWVKLVLKKVELNSKLNRLYVDLRWLQENVMLDDAERAESILNVLKLIRKVTLEIQVIKDKLPF